MAPKRLKELSRCQDLAPRPSPSRRLLHVPSGEDGLGRRTATGRADLPRRPATLFERLGVGSARAKPGQLEKPRVLSASRSIARRDAIESSQARGVGSARGERPSLDPHGDEGSGGGSGSSPSRGSGPRAARWRRSQAASRFGGVRARRAARLNKKGRPLGGLDCGSLEGNQMASAALSFELRRTAA
jgi:hypothetical protein